MRRAIKGKARLFFSEEKNQKTPNSVSLPGYQAMAGRHSLEQR
jgi:hypothetical protein